MQGLKALEGVATGHGEERTLSGEGVSLYNSLYCYVSGQSPEDRIRFPLRSHSASTFRLTI